MLMIIADDEKKEKKKKFECFNSVSSSFNHIAFCVMTARVIYSVSVKNRATVCCHLDIHEIVLSVNVKTYSVVDF